jgi:hypothetical protein
MAAYAVMVRIGRVDPQLTFRDIPGRDDEPGLPGGLAADALDDVPALETDRASEPGEIVERLIRMRELWRQTTFYLFDANSWRI